MTDIVQSRFTITERLRATADGPGLITIGARLELNEAAAEIDRLWDAYFHALDVITELQERLGEV